MKNIVVLRLDFFRGVGVEQLGCYFWRGMPSGIQRLRVHSQPYCVCTREQSSLLQMWMPSGIQRVHPQPFGLLCRCVGPEGLLRVHGAPCSPKAQVDKLHARRHGLAS